MSINTNNNNAMGRRIKRLRLQHGYTQEELGSFIGISRASINKIENGTTENIKRHQIEILAKKLETSPVYLMGWEDPNVIPQTGGRLKGSEPFKNEIIYSNELEASINEKLKEALKSIINDKNKARFTNDLDITLNAIINSDNMIFKDKVVDNLTETLIKNTMKSFLSFLNDKYGDDK